LLAVVVVVVMLVVVVEQVALEQELRYLLRLVLNTR
jgi:hypothetical protein